MPFPSTPTQAIRNNHSISSNWSVVLLAVMLSICAHVAFHMLVETAKIKHEASEALFFIAPENDVMIKPMAKP